MQRIWIAAVVLLAGVAQGQNDAVYVRRLTSPEQAVARLETSCANRGTKQALVIFDQATFDQNRTRWSPHKDEYPYHRDFESWLDTLAKWKEQTSVKVLVATTISRKPMPLQGPWREKLRGEIPKEGERAEKQREIKPAHKWIAKFAKSLRKGSAIVLVTGDIVPDLARTFRDKGPAWFLWENGQPPRRGDPYWVHDEVEKVLLKRKLVFHVVAPECRFGGFTPTDEVPQMPWVARPTMGLKGTHRFIARTMRSRAGSRAINTECPSGFGAWTYARLASVTNGRFLLYPFPKSSVWRDSCLFDPTARSRLAPPLVSRREYFEALAKDPVTKAIAEAVAMVQSRTPHYMSEQTGVGQTAWFPFESATRVKLSDNFHRGWRPTEWVELTTNELKKRYKSENPFKDALPHYERAQKRLRALQARIESGEVEGLRACSGANLRLSIFWFSMATFHLKSRAMMHDNLHERLGSDFEIEKGERLFHWAWCVVRMSDCLDPLPGLPKPKVGNWPYRAKRTGDAHLRRLGPELQPLAERVVEDARAVREHEGATPWGWMVYYAELLGYSSVVKGTAVRGGRARSGTKKTTTPTELPPPPVVNPGAGSVAPTSGG
jgi:hypothetical protein